MIISNNKDVTMITIKYIGSGPIISGTMYILTTTSISILNMIHVHNAKITKLLKYVFLDDMLCFFKCQS